MQGRRGRTNDTFDLDDGTAGVLNPDFDLDLQDQLQGAAPSALRSELRQLSERTEDDTDAADTSDEAARMEIPSGALTDAVNGDGVDAYEDLEEDFEGLGDIRSDRFRDR